MIKNNSKFKKDILFLMHVDWGWAKQRPHFLAEKLANRYDVTVSFKHEFRKNNLVASEMPSNIKFKTLLVLPFSRFNFIERLNKILIRIQLTKSKRIADIVWLTHPILYQYIRGNLSDNSLIVYDCMDDVLEFPDALGNGAKIKILRELEMQLVNRSNLIISSSLNLKHKLLERYGHGYKVTVVNNAFEMLDDNSFERIGAWPYSVQAIRKIEGIKILYIGTISLWFDFESIIESLNRFEEITYVLVGPCEVVVPNHQRLIILPPVEHKYVITLMALSDALIMPFHVNELIKSVNPVKLYEYVYSQKPALAISYAEVEYFKDYIYLYKSRDELYEYLKLLISGLLSAKSSQSKAFEFLKSNTWEMRASKVFQLLENSSC